MRTIEFRQHTGILGADRVVAWVHLVVGLVTWAKSVDDDIYTSYVVEPAEDHDNGVPFPDLMTLLNVFGLKGPAKYYRERLIGGREPDVEVSELQSLGEEFVVESSDEEMEGIIDSDGEN